MRWKLVVLVSLAATVIASVTFCSLVILVFEQFSTLGVSQSYLILMPLTIAILAAGFVYRHTARKRKTHLVITAVLTLILTVFASVAVARWYQTRYFRRTANPSSGRL